MGTWNDDDRLLIRAIREGWDVPAARKPDVIRRLLELATEPLGNQSVKAANALFKAAKLQMDATKLDLLLEERAELKARLAALEGAMTDEQSEHVDPPPRTDPPDGRGGGDGNGPAGPEPA